MAGESGTILGRQDEVFGDVDTTLTPPGGALLEHDVVHAFDRREHVPDGIGLLGLALLGGPGPNRDLAVSRAHVDQAESVDQPGSNPAEVGLATRRLQEYSGVLYPQMRQSAVGRAPEEEGEAEAAKASPQAEPGTPLNRMGLKCAE